MIRRSIVRSVVLAGVISLGLSLPALAQGVGAIGGTVSDSSGAVLPGVTLTLIAPGMIGNGQTAVSDGQGAYEFTRLVPGTYSVKAELEGFRTALQENLAVNADRTARADLKLAVGSVQESVTVMAEAPLLDTTSTLHQTELTHEVLDSVPMGRDQWSIGQMIPSAHDSAVDVGGRNMALNSSISIHGSLARETGYLVDGLDHSTPQEGNINNKWDTNVAEEVNIQSGQVLADTPKAGVQMNMITKTGTNTFKGTGLYEGTNHSLESNNVTGALRTQLLAAVPAKALAANPNIVPGSSTQVLYDSGIEEGGPIIKDRLWFVGAYRQSRVNSFQVGDYNSDGTQLLNDNLLQNVFGKVSWATTKNSQFHGWIQWSRQDRPHQNGSSATQFASSATTTLQDGRTWIEMPRWTAVLSKRMVLDIAGAVQHGQNNKAPQPTVQPGDIPRFDSVTNTITVAAPTYGATCCDNKVQGQAALTVVAGSHDLKVGYQYLRSNRSTFFYSVMNPDGSGLQAQYANGLPSQVVTYNTPSGSVFVNFNNAIFLQDKWRVTHRLTANLGLRTDHSFERVNDGTSPICQTGTVFIAAQCFPAVSGVPNWWYAAPRLSAIYDVFGDGRTALKFTANRYEISTVGLTGLVDPAKFASDTRPWSVCAPGQTSGCDLNHDGIPQLNELGASTGFKIGTTNTIDPNLKVPYTNEIAAEIEQELGQGFVVSAGYHYRARRNQIGFANQAVPTSAYTPITVTEVTSGQTVTVYNQSAATKGLNQSVYTNYPQLDDYYKSLDLLAQKRMSHHWMMMASATFEKTLGDIYTVGGQNTNDLNNPNFTFREGPQLVEIPFLFKADGVYEAPYGLRLGFTTQFYKGGPTMTTVSVTSATVKLTQGTQSILVAPFGTTRLPNISTTDFNITKILRAGKMRFEPHVSFFNIFNQAAITSETTQLGPSYGNALTLLGARLIKLGVSATW
jgi:hypothetical protein